MIHFGHKLKSLVDHSGFKNREIAKFLDITEGNLYKIYNKEHLRTDVIAQFCEFLKIPFQDFFNENPTDKSGPNISGDNTIYQSGNGDKSVIQHALECEKEVEYLKKFLEMKDELLKEKENVNELLRKRLGEIT